MFGQILRRCAAQDRSAIRNPKSAIGLLAVSLHCFGTVNLRAQIDPRGNWRTWHTPHFRVNARTEHAAVAAVAATEAERAYAALATELRVPRGTIDLVLHDNVDFSNGFATVFPSNRISIFLTPPASEIGLGRYDEWLRLVITHELTHIFHLDRADGIWGIGQRVFGRAAVLFPNVYRPGWVLEGLATYYESRLTAGGRGRGGFHSQLLLAAAQGHRWPAPGDANFSNSRWPGGLEPYAFGSRFFMWEAQAYGDTVIPRFIDHTSRRLWPLTISGPIKNAGGGGLGSDWKRFRRDWDAALRSDSSSAIITRGLRFEPRPRISPDGRRLVYVRADGRSRERVVIRDLDSGREVASRKVNGAPELAWIGPDLILAQLDYTDPVEIRSALYRWSPGGTFSRATTASRLTRPFALKESDVGAVALGPSRTSVVRLVGDSGVATISAPEGDAWAHVDGSPDGRYLAGARHAKGQWDIVLWPTGSPSEARRVTDDAALDDDPSWSVDGTVLTFSSERTGLPQIYAYDLATGAVTQMTDEPTGAREGELAGESVYFSTLLHDGYAVMSRKIGRVAARPVEPPRAMTVPQPEPVSMRETGYSAWRTLTPRYWLPLFHDAGPSGQFLGAATTGNDVVERTAYAVGAGHALRAARWEGYAGFAHTRWSAFSLDAAALQFWDVGPTVTVAPGTSATLLERDRLLSAGGTLRYRRWRSEISGRLGGEMTQDAFFVPPPYAGQYPNPMYGGAVVSGAAGYVTRQALSISNEDGVLINALYRRRWVVNGPGWSDEARAIARGYLSLPLPGFAHWVLAGRVAGAVSGGPNAKPFALGGVSSAGLSVIPGVSLGGGNRDFGLRGYPPGGSVYTRVLVSAAELRIPLFLIGRAIWKLPLSINRVSLSLFGETGDGWQASGARRLAQYRDAGAELVMDIGLNFDAPLRVRLGTAQALTTGLGANQGDWRGFVALGSSF